MAHEPTPPPVVELSSVSLRYRLAKQRLPSVKDYAIHWLKGALVHEALWALREVDLVVGRGEMVGIVGRNGAGKSSLLKVVSGVLKPTRGEVAVHGTIAPILELGTGFDFELTGLENIYLNALLLGHHRQEIDDAQEGIVEFSGLREFIHSPIRNYSSGMLARLGFAIATAWIPDLLILDEVLAVGDAAFIQRCERRIDELRTAGTAVLLVTHDLGAVGRLCERAIWLERGAKRLEGSPADVLAGYNAST